MIVQKVLQTFGGAWKWNEIFLKDDAIFISGLQIIPPILARKRPFEGDIILVNCPKRSNFGLGF